MGGFCRFGHRCGLWYTFGMNPIRRKISLILFQATRILAWAVMGMVLSAPGLSASESPLELATRSQVSGDGKVTLDLTLKNSGRNPVVGILPAVQ